MADDIYVYKPLNPKQDEPSTLEKIRKALAPREDTFVGPKEEPGLLRKYAPMAVRGGSALLGITPLTGAVSGAAGEYLAEMIEKGSIDPRDIDFRRVAGEAATGAVMGKYAKGLGEALKLGKTGVNMLKGGAYGAAAPIIRHGVEEGDVNPLNYKGEELMSTGMGALTAGALSKLHNYDPLSGVGHSSIVNEPAIPPPTPAAAPPPKPTVDYRTKKGLRVALDDLRQVPTTDPTYAPNSQTVTPDVLAKHKALALEQGRNPTGPIASEIGPPLTKTSLDENGAPVWKRPSLAEMEDLHGKALATDAKVEAASTKDLEKEGTQLTKNENARTRYENMIRKARGAADAEVEKATEKSWQQEAKNLNSRDKYTSTQQAQDAKNLNAKAKAIRQVEIANANASTEDAKRTAAGWNQEAKNLNAAGKKSAQMDAQGLKDVAAETKAREDAWKQEAKNLEATGRYKRGVEVARANADTEAGKMAAAQTKADQNAANLELINSKKEGLIQSESNPRESISATNAEGNREGITRSWNPPVEEEGAGGGGGGGNGTPVNPTSPTNWTPNLVHQTEFSTIKQALEAAATAGGGPGTPHRMARGRYRFIYKTPPEGLPPFDPSAPPAPKAPVPEGPGGAPSAATPPTEMPPGTDRLHVESQRWGNKNDAAAVAKLTGGEVHQDGQGGLRKYSVRFAPAESPEVPAVEPVSTEPTPLQVWDAGGPPPKYTSLPASTEPTTPPSGAKLRDQDILSPEEFSRYMNSRPLTGIKRTPEEIADYKLLQGKLNAASRVAPEVSTEPILHQIEAPIPETAPQVNPQGEVEPVLPGVKPTVNPAAKPVADLPYTLDGGKTPSAPTAQQPSLIEQALGSESDGKINPSGHGTQPGVPLVNELPSEVAGGAAPTQEGGAAPIRFFNSPLEAAGENYGAVKAAKAAGEAVPEEGRRAAGAAAQRLNKEAQAAQPPAQPGDWIAQQLAEVERLKGQKGEISPALMLKGGLGVAGALGGAAYDDEHPLRGALVGGLAGVGAGAVSSKLPSLLSGEESFKDITEPLVARFPNYMRGSLLSDPRSIIHNSLGGPWGSHFFGGLEEAAKGAVTGDTARKEAGQAALKTAMNPAKWLKGFWEKRGEAFTKLHDVEEQGRAGSFIEPANKNLLDQAAEIPAGWMLAGDMNSRDFLEEAGIDEATVRKITNTAEPQRALWKNVVNWGKAKAGPNDEGGTSALAQAMLPFKRTAANIMENGTERTPILGSIINYRGDENLRIPWKEQAVQQGIGTGAFAAGYEAGLHTDEKVNKDFKIRSMVSNMGGNYALLTSAGFAAGQAARLGKSPLSGAVREYTTNGIPLPTAEPINDMLSVGQKVVEGQPLSQSDFPSALKPKIFDFLLDDLPASLGVGQNQPTGRPPRPENEYTYRPLNPRKR